MAIEDLSKAIALAPNNAKHYVVRGLAYAQSGNMGRAISDLQKACDMGIKSGVIICRRLYKADNPKMDADG